MVGKPDAARYNGTAALLLPVPGSETAAVKEVSVGYVMDNLMKTERILYEGKLHWTIYFSLRALLTLFIAPLIARRSSEFAVTNRRVMIKVGLWQRRTLELNLSKVESIEVDQSSWGRLFGFGSIEVIGTGGTRERFERIGAPLAFRKAVFEAAEAMQVELGGPRGGVTADAAAALEDPETRIAKAKQMLDRGLISPEEFDAVRRRILDTI